LQRNRPTLLLTRPEAPSWRFLDELRAALGSDWPAVISPLMKTRFIDAAIPDCAGIVFTSDTAVRAVERMSTDRTALAWCVGPRTEAAARAAGYRTRRGTGTALGLADQIIAASPNGKVFCPTAADRAFDMATTLNNAGIETISASLYAQEACPPTAEVSALLAASGPVILPLFSPRSARLAAEAFDQRSAPILVVAISAEVAAAALALAPLRVVTARTPDSQGMIAAIAESSESG
jgi:uroporphyrinogen-III synthase